MPGRHNAAFTAVLAAALFGATTPLAKTLLGTLSPYLLRACSTLAVALAWLSQHLFDVYAGRWANGKMKVAFTPRKCLGFWAQ
jgi:hypothetical protein